MSSAQAPAYLPSTSAAKSSTGKIILGDLGYVISVALGFLVLFSSTLLICYVCYVFAAARRRRRRGENRIQNVSIGGGGAVISVVVDDDPRNDVVVAGLEERVINSYPKFVYLKRGREGWNDVVCSICLSEYVEQEVLRMLPDCSHCFHAPCVDAWLKLNASCPVCRTSPLPSANSTPLQAVVPAASQTP